MARYRGPRLRITRRLGDLPGLTRKAAKRSYPPGQHGQARRKRSEYAIRLEEKQKLRFNYGVSERQLVRYVKKARAQEGSTGTNLLKLLENRLDNVCFRLGFGPTVPGARQLVNHGHVTLNGRVTDIASYQCKPRDVIAIRERKCSKKLAEATGCEVDRGGGVIVQHDFSIADHPEIRVAGDLSSYSHTSNGKPLPGMAAPAKQAGTFIGKDIAAIVADRPRPTFSYSDFGSMAVLDRASAVADLRGLRFADGIGWILWAFVHLVLIPDWENRISLSIKWIFALLTQQRAAILLTGMPSQHMALDAVDAHFPMKAGEGVSIAEPDAALEAAMDYYSHQITGHPQPQELIDTRVDSAADSAAAIK